MNTIDVLKGARELLADPERWTQHTTARDAKGGDLVERFDGDEKWEGRPVACHPDACAWCLGGALDKVSGEIIRYDDPRFTVLWNLVDEEVGPWNDRHKHADVLYALDCAIAKAEAK